METRTLGGTGLTVSAIGFGGWAIGGNDHGNSYGPTRDEESVAAVERALELGCTFYDTADVYGWGHSEELLGQALADRREEVVLATKVGGDFYHGGVQMRFDPEYVRFALGKSLERLQTDYIDLYQLHNPPLPLLGDPSLYDVLDTLREEARIRHAGVSIHRPEEGHAVVEAARAEAIQVPLSIYRQEWLDGLFPVLEEGNVGVIAREPLGNGFLTGKYDPDDRFPPGDIRSNWPPNMIAGRALAAQKVREVLSHREETLGQLALKFCLAFDPVTVVIPGAKTTNQVEENVAAAEGPPLSGAEVEALRELYRRSFGL